MGCYGPAFTLRAKSERKLYLYLRVAAFHRSVPACSPYTFITRGAWYSLSKLSFWWCMNYNAVSPKDKLTSVIKIWKRCWKCRKAELKEREINCAYCLTVQISCCGENGCGRPLLTFSDVVVWLCRVYCYGFFVCFEERGVGISDVSAGERMRDGCALMSDIKAVDV